MSLSNKALAALRRVFGVEREERRAADSPTAAAAGAAPASLITAGGHEEYGGLLSVSQALADRYADYESMEEYPDIACIAAGSLVYTLEERVIKSVPIEQLQNGAEILAYDTKRSRFIGVAARNPRLTGRHVPIVEVCLSNGRTLRCTTDHLVLTTSGYKDAVELALGDEVVSAHAGFVYDGTSIFLNQVSGIARVVEGVKVVGTSDVYDITTDTHNFLCEGVVVHNSAFRYYASDATQPNITDHKALWISSKDAAVKGLLDDLLNKRLRVEDELWSQAYTLAMYGNCLPASARVWLKDSVKPIIDVVCGDEVAVFTDGRFVTATVEAFFANGVKPILKLVSTNRVIRATADHKLLRERDGVREWVKMSDLADGDAVVVANGAISQPDYGLDHVISIEPDGSEEVFDIRVGHEAHNFVADGVVVHNCFEELLVNESGIVGLNHLPTPTMRRVEAPDGGLIGYIQDVTGQFTANGAALREMLAGNTQLPPHVVLFEDWQVVQMKLCATRRRAPYGYCIPADGMVSTPDGDRSIADLRVGDAVFCHEGGVRKATRVVDHVCNGRRPVINVIAGDYAIRATANHPFLVQGSWRELGEVRVGDSVAVFADGCFKHAVVDRLESGDEVDVYDIAVESSEHNFICNGFVVHNSVGDAGRWIWKRLVMLEDLSIIYKLTRVPRYVYAIDVTDVPPDRVEGHLRKAKRDLRKKSLVNPSTGRLDMRYNVLAQDEDYVVAIRDGKELARVDIVSAPEWASTDSIDYFKRMLHGVLNVPRAWLGQDEPIQSKGVLCLTGDTRIPLLDGRTRTMEELTAEYGDGGRFHVYSVGHDGRIMAGAAHTPCMTRPNAEIWEVVLDNGESVRGTPDHPFMRRDGSYCRLDELQSGDSLMPLYRRDSVASRDRLDGYEMYQSVKDGKWRFTHRMVAAAKWRGRSLRSEGRVIHHSDYDKRNNAPSNLCALLKERHMQIHREHAERTLRRPDVVAKAIRCSAWWRNSEANKALCRSNLRKARMPGGNQHKWCKSQRHRNMKSAQMTEQWREPGSKLMRRTQSAEFRAASSARMKASIREGKIRVRGADNVKFRSDASYERLVDVAASYRCKSMRDLCKWTRYSTCLVYRLLRDVGLSYEEFAEQHLVNGYVLCAKGADNHKVVSVKMVGRADCYDFVVDDVHNYAVAAGVFVHNSNEDVRAARITLNLQREIRNGYERICRIHLAARGIADPWAPDFVVAMTSPSGIWELAAYEVLNAKADYASRIQPFVSTKWIQENILNLSDHEIKAIEKQASQGQEQGLFPGPMGGSPPMGPQPAEAPEAPPGEEAGAEEGPKVPEGAPETAAAEPEPAEPAADKTAAAAQQRADAAADKAAAAARKVVALKKKLAPEEWVSPSTRQKTIDAARRLEEHRYRESNRRHSEIMDKLGVLLENGDSAFAIRDRERRAFFKELKHVIAPHGYQKNGSRR